MIDIGEIDFRDFWDTLDELERDEILADFYNLISYGFTNNQLLLCRQRWLQKYENWLNGIAEGKQQKIEEGWGSGNNIE